MKISLFALALLCVCTPAISQQEYYMRSTNMTTMLKAEAGFHGIGIAFEPAVANNFSVDMVVSAGNGYTIETNSFNYLFILDRPAFSFSVTPKYYYNLSKRASKGKRTDMNSGNYIGLRAKVSGTTDLGYDDVFLANLHWGIQRPLGERWLFNTHAGIGYARDFDGAGAPYPSIDFKFSYVIFKKSAVPWKNSGN